MYLSLHSRVSFLSPSSWVALSCRPVWEVPSSLWVMLTFWIFPHGKPWTFREVFVTQPVFVSSFHLNSCVVRCKINSWQQGFIIIWFGFFCPFFFLFWVNSLKLGDIQGSQSVNDPHSEFFRWLHWAAWIGELQKYQHWWARDKWT